MRDVKEGPGRLLRQSLPGPMFAADMETPNAEGVMGPLCVHLPAPACSFRAYYFLWCASADKGAGTAGRGSRADARRESASGPRLPRWAADLPPDRSDGGDRAQRGPRRLEPSGLVVVRPPLGARQVEADVAHRPLPGERRAVDGLRRAA